MIPGSLNTAIMKGGFPDIPNQGDLLFFYNANEGAGTTLSDDAGIVATNGTLSSSALWTPDGIEGAALESDGTNYVNFGSTLDILGILDSPAWEICFAVYPQTSTDVIWAISSNYQSSGTIAANNDGFLAWFESSTSYTLTFRVKTGTTVGYNGAIRGSWNTGLNYKVGEWNLVFCRRSSTFAGAFIYNSDGVSSATLSGSFSTTLSGHSSNTSFHALHTTTSGFIPSTNGSGLDMIGGWSSFLEPNERADLWNNGLGNKL